MDLVYRVESKGKYFINPNTNNAYHTHEELKELINELYSKHSNIWELELNIDLSVYDKNNVGCKYTCIN